MRQSHRRVTSVPLPGSFQLTASLGALVQTFLLMRMAEVVVVEETTFRCGHGTHRHWLADWLTDCRLSGYLSADQGQTVPRPLSPTLVVHFSLVHRLLRHLSLFLIFFYFLWKRVEEREHLSPHLDPVQHLSTGPHPTTATKEDEEGHLSVFLPLELSCHRHLGTWPALFLFIFTRNRSQLVKNVFSLDWLLIAPIKSQFMDSRNR